jgi:hypothetical protein
VESEAPEVKYVLVLVAACATQASPTAARYDRCDAITVHAAPDDAEIEKAILVQRCAQDAWSEDAIRCFSVAASKAVLDGCFAKLPDSGTTLRAELDQALGGAALAKLVEIRAEMCACKSGNIGCAVRVRRTWDDYTAAHKERPIDGPSAAQVHQASWIADEAAKCEQRARNDAMAAITGFRDKMCACKVGDKDCVMAVQRDMAEYDMTQRHGSSEQMSNEDIKQATNVAMELAQCMTKALTGP